jgi:hypothetical protein
MYRLHSSIVKNTTTTMKNALTPSYLLIDRFGVEAEW